MLSRHVFLTFDISNTKDYTKFYEELKNKGFTSFIPGDQTSSKNEASLPTTTVFAVKKGESDQVIKNNVRNEIKNIYKKLGLEGEFIVINAISWGTQPIKKS